MTGPTKTERSNLNFGARGKRRSLSQRVGKVGQLAFEQWAVEQSLVANPCRDDYGIDYFCQVLSSPSGKYKTEETRGDVLAVQVRATIGTSRPRIKLDKIDAEAALRIESPYAIIAVEETRKKVYFKFLDAEFAKQLAEFIASREAALILRLESGAFRSDDFRTALTQRCNPGVQHRLRIYCAELCLQKDIPGARLRISHDASSGFAVVEVPWISSIFHVPRDNEEEFRRVVFEHGHIPQPGISGVSIHPSLFKMLDIAGTDQLIVKGTFEHDIGATIQLSGISEKLTFRVRTAGDEMAFVSECGLVLTMSESKSDRSGAHFHKLYFALSHEYGRSLDTFSEFDPALRLFKPGATLSFNTTGNDAIDIKSWGPAFEHLGEGYEQILLAYAFSGISLDEVYLADLVNEEFARSIAVLASFSSGATLPYLMPSVLVGPAAADSKYEDRLELRRFEVPVVMNVKSRGVIVWVRGDARVYVDDNGFICGFLPQSQSGYKVEVRPAGFGAKSNTPEVWVSTHWPAIKLLEQSEEFSTCYGGINHELAGRLWAMDSGADESSADDI
jgi:hypothetical protein